MEGSLGWYNAGWGVGGAVWQACKPMQGAREELGGQCPMCKADTQANDATVLLYMRTISQSGLWEYAQASTLSEFISVDTINDPKDTS